MSAAAMLNAFGWTLLHFVWQGAAIGLLVAVALALLGRARPQLRYLVACAGLMACLLWPLIELLMRLRHVGTMGGAYASVVFGARTGARSGSLLATLQEQLPWIVALWALCAAVLALRMALGLVWIGRSARSRRLDAHWQAATSHMALRFGVKRAVGVGVVDDLDSPLTAGWWRPLILLPASLVSGMPHELLEALLAHEMAHVKRCDYLVNLLQNVAEIVLFYHPAVWWISGRIRLERELIADDMAARVLGEPRRLALALSELEKLQFSRHHLAMAANGGDLLVRVRRLLQPGSAAANWHLALPALLLAVACASAWAHTAKPVPVAELAGRAVAPSADFNSCAKPVWPRSALRYERTGTVTLGFLISPEGKVVDTRLHKSSGHADLDEAARAGISQCSFKPGKVDGVAVGSWMRMQYVWTLK